MFLGIDPVAEYIFITNKTDSTISNLRFSFDDTVRKVASIKAGETEKTLVFTANQQHSSDLHFSFDNFDSIAAIFDKAIYPTSIDEPWIYKFYAVTTVNNQLTVVTDPESEAAYFAK